MSDDSASPSRKLRRERRSSTSPTSLTASVKLEDEEEHVEPPAFSLATLGLHRVGTVPPPKPQPQQPLQILNARGMPARIRKRNRFFYDDDIINDNKPLRVSLSPRKTPSKTSPPTTKTTPTKVMKKRKGVVSRYMRCEEKHDSSIDGGGLMLDAMDTDGLDAVTPLNNSNIKCNVDDDNDDDDGGGGDGCPSSSSIVADGGGGGGGGGSSSNGSALITTPTKMSGIKSGGGNATATATSTPLSGGISGGGGSGGAIDGCGGNSVGLSGGVVGLGPIPLTTPSQVIPADKKIGQRIGLRLRNLLKLPKAHKWVIFEWFYSFVDKPLFEGDNEFQVCLSESFPNLRTRLLTRPEWQKIRSIMGKPRRCSQAFFDEERRELERKRQKIRFMQTQKSGNIRDVNFVRDMPDRIPLPLPVGTKVTARLRVPQDGIFSGRVDAFDSQSSSYRVTFDRIGLGTHSIPDYEIVSESFHGMLPVHSITRDFRPNLISIYNGSTTSSSPYKGGTASSGARNVRQALNLNLNKSDPLLGQEVIESPFKNPVLDRENINGYPAKLLETLVRLKRALDIKSSKLKRLSDMNNEAELKATQQTTATTSTATAAGAGAAATSIMMTTATNHNHSNNNNNNNCMSTDELHHSVTTADNATQLNEDFQRRYASIVISMEKMNRDMQDYLNDVQVFAGELTRDPQIQAMLAPSYLREKCREAADDAVQRNNQGLIQNKEILLLIKNLATVLLVASHLSNDGNSAQVSKVMEGCIEEVKSGLMGVNVETFQKNVQIHLHHIRLGIGQSMMTATAATNATSADI